MRWLWALGGSKPATTIYSFLSKRIGAHAHLNGFSLLSSSPPSSLSRLFSFSPHSFSLFPSLSLCLSCRWHCRRQLSIIIEYDDDGDLYSHFHSLNVNARWDRQWCQNIWSVSLCLDVVMFSSLCACTLIGKEAPKWEIEDLSYSLTSQPLSSSTSWLRNDDDDDDRQRRSIVKIKKMTDHQVHSFFFFFFSSEQVCRRCPSGKRKRKTEVFYSLFSLRFLRKTHRLSRRLLLSLSLFSSSSRS